VRTETFETPGEVRLDVRLGAGEIRLETGDGNETTVVLEPLRDNDASRNAVEGARVELRERSGGFDVVVDARDRQRGFGLGRGAEVLVEIRAPDGVSVNSKSGSADIEGNGRFGTVDVETGSGDVSVGQVGGDAKINAASGDVQLASVGGEARINTASGDVQAGSIGGDAKINSASGDVILRDVAGSLDVNSASGDVLVREVGGAVSINTASGDQAVGSVSSGSVTLKSASGDLKVGVREGATLWIDARSRSGEVRSELPVSELPPEGDSPVVEIRANTMSGDITVTRA
jgi:DUF4097 and DUF4098 domain-containing protein YvlB